MIGESQKSEVELTPEQLIAAMTDSMQTALAGCGISQTQLDKDSQERFVSVSLPRNIQPSYIQLREVVSGDGAKTYEYGQVTYHDPSNIHGYKWNEGDGMIQLTMGSRDMPRDLGAVSEVDPRAYYFGGFDSGNAYFGHIRNNIARVPELHEEQLRLEEFLDKDKPRRILRLRKLFGKLRKR
jgi:hypothetical protein